MDAFQDCFFGKWSCPPGTPGAAPRAGHGAAPGCARWACHTRWEEGSSHESCCHLTQRIQLSASRAGAPTSAFSQSLPMPQQHCNLTRVCVCLALPGRLPQLPCRWGGGIFNDYYWLQFQAVFVPFCVVLLLPELGNCPGGLCQRSQDRTDMDQNQGAGALCSQIQGTCLGVSWLFGVPLAVGLRGMELQRSNERLK